MKAITRFPRKQINIMWLNEAPKTQTSQGLNRGEGGLLGREAGNVLAAAKHLTATSPSERRTKEEKKLGI